MSRLTEALGFTDRGWKVSLVWWMEDGHCACGKSDCDSPGKHSILTGGSKDSTDDPDTLKQWWTEYPKAHIGIACGEVSGIVVWDVDKKHGGLEKLQAIEEEHGKLLPTFTVRTGGGGRHLYYKFSDEVVKLLKKLSRRKKGEEHSGFDVKTSGYVMSAGSDHLSGQRYEVEGHPLAECAPLPFKEETKLAKKPKPKSIPIPDEEPCDDVRKERAQRRLETLAELVATAIPGERHNSLNHAALEVGHHIHSKNLDYDLAYKLLFAAAKKQTDPKSDEEIRKTLEAALHDGMEHPAKYASVRYAFRDGCTYWLKSKTEIEGVVVENWIKLCNFTPRIVAQQLLDDDTGQVRRIYSLRGHVVSGRELPLTTVPADDFAGLNWIEDAWGLEAVVEASYGTKENLRVAIKTLSPDCRTRTLYQHTGFRKINGQWLYLSGNGAIGANGPVDGIDVDLGPGLERYHLGRRGDVREAMQISLQLLNPDFAPQNIMVPLWALMFRAPLGTVLPLDVGIHLRAPTGRMKSTLAALCLCHYGTFLEERIHKFPENWTATANSLELKTHVMKDAVLGIDDYNPLDKQRREYEDKFDRVFRGLANQQGRSRLNRDARLKSGYTPRGSSISTGEDMPHVQSLLARIIVLEPQPNQVHLQRLTELQHSHDQLSIAMAGYVAWLCPRLDRLKPELEVLHSEAVDRMRTDSSVHPRVHSNIAQLLIGVFFALRYAAEIRVITYEEQEPYYSDCERALLEVGVAQSRTVASETPVLRFLSGVCDLLAAGEIHLAKMKQSADDLRSQGRHGLLIGWQDDVHVYLLPGAAYKAVTRDAQARNEALITGSKALWQAFVQEGLLAQVGVGRPDVSKRLGGGTPHVMVLDRKAIQKKYEIEFPGLPEQRHLPQS